MAEAAPFGDHALRFDLPPDAPRRHLFDALSAIDGVGDVVLTEEVGCVVFDDPSARGGIVTRLAHVLADVAARGPDERTPERHSIAAVYDGADLDEVATTVGRSREAVIALHAERDYRVAMLGFLPGFAYLRGLAPELVLPRRAPRPRVPPGSIAIAAEYTGIYPFASPGGWHLLGRAAEFRPFGPDGAALALGDVVRFEPVASAPPAPPRAATIDPAPPGPHLEITRLAGFALLVDGGRRGCMHQGVPRGGPLVRALLARANAWAGNDATACAIEVMGTIEVTARGGPVTVADADARTVLAPGDRLVVSTAGRARAAYLAIAGGVDSPMVLGGRGALLAAGIGRLLRRGDHLAPGAVVPSAVAMAPPVAPKVDAPVTVDVGPDAGALAPILAAALRISPASDRTGTRLEGFVPDGPSADGTRRSTPMVPGAIELTPSGPIVLGPDHPTTGGYPVVGVVRSTSLDDLFCRPVGAPVRFHVG